MNQMGRDYVADFIVLQGGDSRRRRIPGGKDRFVLVTAFLAMSSMCPT
jgi:hypothetical protein